MTLIPFTTIANYDEDFIWFGREKNLTPSEMETSHLYNCVRMLWNHYMDVKVPGGKRYISIHGDDIDYHKEAMYHFINELRTREREGYIDCGLRIMCSRFEGIEDSRPLARVFVEHATKWYNLKVIYRMGEPYDLIDFPETHSDLPSNESPFVDHVPNPLNIKLWCRDWQYDIDPLSWDLMVGRWFNEVKEVYDD